MPGIAPISRLHWEMSARTGARLRREDGFLGSSAVQTVEDSEGEIAERRKVVLS